MISKTLRDSAKDNVRQAADIVEVIGEYVTLKKAGTRFVGLCPFHSEKTPSFSVNPDRQFYYCFGCGASGDVFSFLMQYHHMEFPEALKTLADKYQIALPEREMSPEEHKRLKEQEQLYQVNQAAAEFFTQRLLTAQDAEPARAYLRERGIPEDFVRSYQLGYAPAPEQAGWSSLTEALKQRSYPVRAIEQAGLAVRRERGGHYDRFRSRVMFPILDMTGRVVAFGGRILGEGKPKYMNSPETPLFEKSRLLFGLYQHKEAIRKAKTVLIVEGNFDLLSLAVHGIGYVVAPLGTSLTRQHVQSLRGYCREVVLLFDADAAGLKAAMRSIPFFLAEQVECRVALLPEGHDPDTLVREQGAAGIIRQKEHAVPLPEFVFDTLVQQYSLTLQGKNNIVEALKPLIQEAADPAQKNLMISHFSEKLGISPDQFQGRIILRRSEQEPQEQLGKSIRHLPRKERQLIDFLIVYPEYTGEFLEAGMEQVMTEPASCKMIEILSCVQKEGRGTPEALMQLLEGEEQRQYVAEVLMRQDGESEEENWALDMKTEILRWLESVVNRRHGASLQRQIKDAEKRGDTALLMQLLQEKMLAERSRIGH